LATESPPLDPLSALIENVPQLIWAAGANGVSLYVNRFWTEYTGLPGEAGLDWPEVIHPGDRARVTAAYAALLRDQGSGAWRVRMRRKDGSHRFFLCRISPFFDRDHPGIRWVGILTDIEAQLEREAMTARHRQIVETATEGIWMIDADYKTTFVNRRVEEITGYTREEMMGRPYLDFVAPHHLEAIGRRGAEARTSPKKLFTTEIELRRKNGMPVWVRSVATQIFDANGRLTGGLTMISDITDRRRAEEKMRESAAEQQALSRRILRVQEAERRRLAFQLNDEIGRVLALVSANLSAAKEAVEAPAAKKLDESIAIVDRAIAQARGMSLELRPRELDEAGLEAALDWYLDQQRERTGLHFAFTAALKARLPPALETACFRIVQEAITNTIRHARAKGAWVDISDERGLLELEICDDGIGFDPELARRRAAQGMSAGLIGMRERVLLVGGQLDIGSTPSCGTRIKVEIPLDPGPHP
jgi:PAS domain S-box-containing protein